MARLTATARRFRAFCRPIDDDEVPDLRRQALDGIRLLAIICGITAPCGPIFVLVQKVHLQRAALILPFHVAYYFSIAKLTRTEFGRRHTSLLILLLTLGMISASTVETMWPLVTPNAYELMIVCAVSMTLGCFAPWRPLLTLGLGVLCIASVPATHALFDLPTQIPLATFFHFGLSGGITAAIGIQIQRGLSRELERTRRQLAAAEREANLRSEEALQRAADIRGILDNVDEGFLRLSPEGRISGEHSRILDEWFGEVTPDLRFSEYVQRVDQQQGLLLEMGWEQVVDGLLPLELLLAQLPARISAGERTLALRYRPILCGGSLKETIVVVTNVTAEVERERAEAELKDLLGIVEALLRNRDAVLDFAHESTMRLNTLSGMALDRSEALRQIHTLKGNCALFGLSSIARLCHDIESSTLEHGEFSADDCRRLTLAWRPIAALTAPSAVHRRESTLEVDPVEYEQTVKALRRVAPELAASVSSWRLERARGRLERLAEVARATAVRLGREPIDTRIDDGGVRLPERDWSELWGVLVHAVRNAIDHGFESRSDRTAAGKPGAGLLTLRTAQQRDRVIIEIEDDGRGIDDELIRARARERGLPHETEADMLEAVFADGVSSRSEVTEISGRGVGMGAVRSVVLGLGGTVRLRSRKRTGTCLHIELPAAPLRERSTAA